jgi:integrase
VQYPSSYDRVSRIFRCHLLPEFGAEPMNLINRARAAQWRNGRVSEARPETVNKELKTLKACLQRAVDWDVLAVNPLDKGGDSLFLPKREDKPPVWYTTQQLQGLYAVASGRNAALWKLLANTGLRRAELLALRWCDVASDRVSVVSLHERPTKGRRTRVVPLNTAAQEALEALRPGKGEPTYVVRQMSPRSLSRCFLLNATKAGLDGSIHCLRHTFCAQLVMAGVPLRTVQVLAGHADIKTTERYAHLAPDYLANAVTAIAL